MKVGFRALGLWLLAMLAGGLIVWNSHFSADMSFFLPSRPSVEQKLLIGQLQEGVVSRLLMLSIGGGDVQQRAAASKALRARLVTLPEFVSVQNGESGGLDADRDFLLRNRYLMSPAVTPERFTESGLKAGVANSIDMLASPLGMLVKPYLRRDPTGELLELLQGLNPGAQPAMRAGAWSSRDGQRAMMLVQTRALGSDTDGQAQAIATLKREFAAVASKNGATTLSLELSGPGLFAVKSRATIQEEVSRLALISSVGSIAVLLWVYRSLWLLLLGTLPVLSAALAGVVAVSLVHGTVFGITLGFGSALIGEAVDYAIYYFVQSGKLGLDRWRLSCWPTIRLGVMTTVFGFGALLFSGFPGLSQLGLYALSGVIAAALVTRFVLPSLVGPTIRVPDHSRLGEVLRSAFAGMHRFRVVALVAAALACGYLALHRHELWTHNLSVLSTVSREDAELDSRLRAELAAPDSRYMVVVTAPDREQALQAAEQAGQKLDRLVADGVIGGYDSPARFLPSERTQAARKASLPAREVLAPRLAAALADSPLSAEKLQPFLDDLEAARNRPLMTRKDMDGTGLVLVVDSLLTRGPTGWNVLLPLRPVQGADLPIEQVRQAMVGTPALFVDMKGEFNALYGNYLGQALWLSLAGLVAIVALLAFSLRSFSRLVRVMLPLVLTVVIVIAGLYALGAALNLLHLVGMLLIVAVGSNYALMFDATANGEPLEAETLVSMAVANLTTVIGFGTLALSSVPVLRAIGVTVGPGALLALLLSAAFIPHSLPQALQRGRRSEPAMPQS